MTTSRAKFTCIGVDEHTHGGDTYYSARFLPVFGGSKENEEFFYSSPSGSISLTTRKKFFEQNKEYYLDFIEATATNG